RLSETKMAVNPGGSRQRMDDQAGRPSLTGDPMRALKRHDSPTASPAKTASEADQRSAPRFTLLIRAAKLIGPDCEFLCIVRDASEAGVSVRLFHPLPAGTALTLELPNGDRHPIERVWETEGKAGFRFSEPTSFERLVESPSRFAKRALRVRLEVPCDLLVGLRWVGATIGNISQQGALVRTQERLSLIQRVKLRAEGMPEITAKVRWRRNDEYGLSFEDTFQFAELAALAFELQHAEAGRP